MVEINESLLKKAQSSIETNVKRVAKKLFKDKPNEESEKFVQKTLRSIEGCTDPNKSVDDCDLVIEAIVENMAIKHKLFTNLDKVRQLFKQNHFYPNSLFVN